MTGEITETGEELLDIGVKGIVHHETYERAGGNTIRVLEPHSESLGRKIYACQATYTPQDNRGRLGPGIAFWFRIPAGSIEQAFERCDEALAVAGPAFEKRFKAHVQAEARRLVVASKEPAFRRGGLGGNGHGRLGPQ